MERKYLNEWKEFLNEAPEKAQSVTGQLDSQFNNLKEFMRNKISKDFYIKEGAVRFYDINTGGDSYIGNYLTLTTNIGAVFISIDTGRVFVFKDYKLGPLMPKKYNQFGSLTGE